MSRDPSAASLIIDCVELRQATGERVDVRRELVLEDLSITAAEVRGGALTVDVIVESVVEGFVVRGRVDAAWTGECRRCLDDVTGPLDVEIHEIFETDHTEGETWPVIDDRIDLTPVVREAAMLALPIAPLCAEDCAGPVPDRFPTGSADDERGASSEPPRDPRWAVLDELSFDEDEHEDEEAGADNL